MKIFAVVIILSVGVTTSNSKPQQPNESFTNSLLQTSTTATDPTNEDDVKQTPVTSSSSDVLYGESDAEQLGELSVIDVLFRKRRNLSGKSGNTEEEKETTEKTGYSPVVVEEIEFYYEDISGDDDDSTTNITSTTDQSQSLTKGGNKNSPTLKTYLTPPSEDNVQINSFK